MDRVLIRLPISVCDDLLEEEDAELHMPDRSGVVGTVIEVAVDVINTGSAVVSIGVAGNYLRKMARSILRQANPGIDVSLELRGPSGKRSLTIRASDPLAEPAIADFVKHFINDTN